MPVSALKLALSLLLSSRRVKVQEITLEDHQCQSVIVVTIFMPLKDQSPGLGLNL